MQNSDYFQKESQGFLSTEPFRTKKEAHIFRLKILLPRLFNKNEDLYNNSYFPVRAIKQAAADDGYWHISDFVRQTDELYDMTISLREDFTRFKDCIHLLTYDELKHLDEEVTRTLTVMQCSTAVPPVEEITIVNENLKARDEVEYFQNLLKAEAIKMLNINRKEVDKTRVKYSVLKHNPYSTSGKKVWSTFQEVMNWDKDLDNKDMAVVETMEKLILLNSGVIVTDKTRDTVKAREQLITEGRELRKQISDEREKLYTVYHVGRLIDNRKSKSKSRQEVYEIIRSSCVTAHEKFNEVEKKILNSDMPLYKLPFLVAKVLEKENINDNSDDPYSKEVLSWLKKKTKSDRAKENLCTGVSLGLALVCLIPGIGLGAIIALGAVGAGVGAIGAIREYEVADDLYDAAITGTYGTQKFINQDEAERLKLSASINLCLSLVDAFVSVKAVRQLRNIKKSSELALKSKKITSLLDKNTVNKLEVLGEDSVQRIIINLDSMNNSEKAARYIKGLNSKGLKNLASIEDVNDSLKIINYFDDQQSNIRLLNSIDDYTILLNPESILAKYDTSGVKTLDEYEGLFSNWKKLKSRSVEEIAVILKHRPEAPRIIARVQWSNYSTFGNKSTIFVTDPNDIIGLSVEEIAQRLGFDDYSRELLKQNPNRGLYIDFVELPPDAVVKQFSWDTVKEDFYKIIDSGDEMIIEDLKSINGLRSKDNKINMNTLDEMFYTLSKTPIEKSDTLSKDIKKLQKRIESKIGANKLFTGQHYTADYNFNIGTTEWGLLKPEVGLELHDMIEDGYKVKRINIVGDQVYPVLLDHNLLYTY